MTKDLRPIGFLPTGLSIDLEVGIRDARIHRFAAVNSDTGESFVYKKGDLAKALAELDTFGLTAAYLLGHNLIAFDAPHLAAAKPDLRLLKLPMVDTLRLNPLAFPRNPYHRLIKHYQDGQLKRGRLNDPDLDARLTLDVFGDQVRAFQDLNKSNPDLLAAWHWLTTGGGGTRTLDSLFAGIRMGHRPSDKEAFAAIERLLVGQACWTQGRAILGSSANRGWPLAYALSWLSVAGGNSVMAPWVRHQFPEAGEIVRRLRNIPCGRASCPWCTEHHDARKELLHWFGFSEFRPEPAAPDGSSLQQAIVEAAMRGEHLLAILPTGAGKSLCYQIPALSRYEKTGALTVVISPLVALMSDQVAGLKARNIMSCAAVNGLLSMPERADVLDRIRLGDISILLVSPEQLRNRTIQKVLAQREIGGWVLDEAHCLSKWGHDFRPDYRYVGRFIKKMAGDGPMPPILCLTATAKPDVVSDLKDHFHEKLGVDLRLLDGGATRTNLEFSVIPTTPGEKFAHIHQVLLDGLPSTMPGGAIVYCASRRQTEEVADFLRQKGLLAGYFHAGLPPEAKKVALEGFVRGALRVICATNAFGMGIDKPDVRLVVHADIPGSLENYLQEAGRAGRDRQAASCVLLYTQDDVEKQFSMSARSRLTQREIQSILKSLKNLDRRKRLDGEVIATAGEILHEDADGFFVRDSATDDTRVRTSIAWLEEATLLSREENQVQIFPASLRVATVQEAGAKLGKVTMTAEYRRQLLTLVEALIEADPDDGLTTDHLMGVSGLSAEKLQSALYDLEKLGIASNDTALTAFLHVAVERSSEKRFKETAAIEDALISVMREADPDLGKDGSSPLHLRHAAQRLKNDGHTGALPEKLQLVMKGLAMDGRGEHGGVGSIQIQRLNPETIAVTLHREWAEIVRMASIRRMAAQRLLEHLLSRLPKDQRGNDLLAETTLGKLRTALEEDLVIKSSVKDLPKLLEQAVMWLHEQEIIKLHKGLAIFRAAMTIRLGQDKRNFLKSDFIPLKIHYDEQVTQIHVMTEYAQRGLQTMAEALRLAMEYFTLRQDEFLRRWMPEREKELQRQTTPESWRAIVESLNNSAQQQIVTDDREQTNVLVLAGPGSGKTRVLVHRIAYLVRVKRENPRSILALAYNRHAAAEIRRRLAKLIGDDARGVTVLTCHALAMRLVGISFTKRSAKVDGAFNEVLRQAVALLKGDGLPPEDADEQRDRLLAGFRWILVDEYQDIGAEQYALISAIAGRTLKDEDSKLSLFAVGDDDQNIYAFNGASVEFIRRFEQDYAAKPAYLTDNYRSSANIISASNMIIKPAGNRMKSDRPISIDRHRRKNPPGGDWQSLDHASQGRVQILPSGGTPQAQAVAVMTELRRLAAFDSTWNWTNVAVIAKEWKFLNPVRAYCELNGIPVQMADEDAPPFWFLRETQALVTWLLARKKKLIDAKTIESWLAKQLSNPWWEMIKGSVAEYGLDSGDNELPTDHFIEWLAEWAREVRRKQTGLLLLTAHRAKGLEFDHAVVLDGAWDRIGSKEDGDASRRLFYVAMTRAKKTLTLAHMNARHPLLNSLSEGAEVLMRPPIDLRNQMQDLGKLYIRMTLSDVDLGFAGRQSPSDPLHSVIASLAIGDRLQLNQSKGVWELSNAAGRVVGRMSKAFNPPVGMHCNSAQVMAIAVWRSKDSDPKYGAKCVSWEVVIPELVFS